MLGHFDNHILLLSSTAGKRQRKRELSVLRSLLPTVCCSMRCTMFKAHTVHVHTCIRTSTDKNAHLHTQPAVILCPLYCGGS